MQIATEADFERYRGKLRWSYAEKRFERWCEGQTGFPLDRSGQLAGLQQSVIQQLVQAEIARQAQVRSVPATVVTRLSIDALMEFDQDTERSKSALEALDRVNRELPEGAMLRWDCCAGLDMKLDMGQQGTCQAGSELYIDDPRAFDLLYEFPHEEVAVVQRPGVAARGPSPAESTARHGERLPPGGSWSRPARSGRSDVPRCRAAGR